MRQAKQSDLDTFFGNAINDKAIYPYLSMSKYTGKLTLPDSDWDGIWLIDNKCNCLLRVTFDRARDLEISICLHSTNTFWAGKAIKAVQEIIKRYKPRAINSVVHFSNKKSLNIHNKIFGQPWGVESGFAWNMGIGEYEDAHYYRLIL